MVPLSHIELSHLAGDGAQEDAESALVAHVSPDGFALVPASALGSLCPGKGCGIGGGDRQDPPLAGPSYRGLYEKRRGTEGVQVHVVVGVVGEQRVHVGVADRDVGEVVEFDVRFDIRYRVLVEVVGGHLGAGDLVGDPHGTAAGGGHGIGDGHGGFLQGPQEHDADVAVERHLLVEEYGTGVDLAGSLGGMYFGDQKLGLPFGDDSARRAQMFSPLMSLTIL